MDTRETRGAPAREASPEGGLRARLGRPVDGASLAVFRIAFGAAMAWQGLRYFSQGWIAEHYVEPDFHFAYLGFGWVRPLPGAATYVEFAVLVATSVLVALGLFTRWAAALLFLASAHWFLIDKTYFNNHYYLQVLVALLLVVLPSNRVGSLDARRAGDSSTVPVWSVWLVRFQLAVVYVYGGLAKLDPDWLTGVPVRAILGEHATTPLLGPFVASPAGGHFFAWSGLVLDLFVAPCLLWRRTRPAAFAAITLFHLANAYLFRIGVFPWLMIGATTVFFEPDWPRRAWSWLRRRPVAPAPRGKPCVPPRTLVAFLGLYGLFQVLVPLRHHLYPRRVTWSEEGLLFSWHMMLRHKLAKGEFVVLDDEGRSMPLDVEWPITPKQWTFMQYDPDCILQFAHFLADRAREQGVREPRVHAVIQCSLNGREPQLLVDPEVDLAQVPRSAPPWDWVLPLASELPPPRPYGGNLDAPAAGSEARATSAR